MCNKIQLILQQNKFFILLQLWFRMQYMLRFVVIMAFILSYFIAHPKPRCDQMYLNKVTPNMGL